jgi:hypothetical protein
MTVVSKSELLRVLRRAGLDSVAEELSELLPDPVDIERSGELLFRYGISRDALLDRLGGSP